MPRFQLPVAVALVVGVLCSLFVFYLRRPSYGKIRLDAEGDVQPEGSDVHDPFDVTNPEDVIDGHPVDEAKFWAKMRLRKLVLTALLAVIVTLSTISLGFSLTSQSSSTIATHILKTIFFTYLLVLSANSITQDTTTSHAQSIQHLSALLFLSALLSLYTAILPNAYVQVVSQPEDEALNGIWYSIFVLLFLAWILAFDTPQGPLLHYPSSLIYSEKTLEKTTNRQPVNVCGAVGASVFSTLLFSYTTPVVMLGHTSTSLEIGDLPIVPGDMRSTYNYALFKRALRTIRLRVPTLSFSSFSTSSTSNTWRRVVSYIPKVDFGTRKPRIGSGWQLAWQLVKVNGPVLWYLVLLASVAAILFYSPAFFLRKLVRYIEGDRERKDRGWGWVFVASLFGATAILTLVTGQLWSLSTTTIQSRLRIQLNSALFAKTLIRKDVASSGNSTSRPASTVEGEEGKENEDDFSSKAQIMTLMTTDVDRVSEFAFHIFTLVDSPIEIIIGSIFLYTLLGVSCFFGLAVTCLFLPMNHFAGKIVVGAQDNLMKARDERVSLMNEILGGIRMLKFMAWERSFEKRVLKIREKELKFQKLNYLIEALWNCIWNASPILVTLVSFWHFAVVRQQSLTPSIAFTSISVFDELKFALNALPETLINMLQSFVSLRRIEKYLHSNEVSTVPPLSEQPRTIALQSATVTWPQDRGTGSSGASSVASTPRHKFILVDLSINFPLGELSLICGKLGSGKTLLLLALLGESDLLAGQVICPRSPSDSLASFEHSVVPSERWVVQGICAYVPQAAWLRNASIKENILFNLPLDEGRYQKTLEVCALVNDLKILEDGDESEIGERGVNLSGGQKARVSLARAVYSRASILLLDDVLSAVDAHTAHHLYHECLKGDLMHGRTVILVSHHVELCAPGASYIVALDNGRVQFSGSRHGFLDSGVMKGLLQSGDTEFTYEKDEATIEDVAADITKSHGTPPNSDTSSTIISEGKKEKRSPRKLVEEEKRAVGRIGRDIWETYIWACGDSRYWVPFIAILVLATLCPVAENGWLKLWSGSTQDEHFARSPMWYISIYAAITVVGLIITTIRWLVLYHGSIHASTVLYERLLETILFANIRFHDTVSRGRVLNRFGKDFEGIDSSLSDNFGRSFMYGLSALTTFITISVVGGLPFVAVAIVLAILYYNVAKVYGQTSRDMRRLDSVTRSPLYSIYGETISGVTILRAFGASSKFMRDMLRCVDTNSNPYYWMWGVNRWLSARFNLLSGVVVGVTGFVAVLSPSIDAALAGFALAFATTITNDLLFMVRRFVGLEQSMVALERVKEYSELDREPPEFLEPRPSESWPSTGRIECKGLSIRYAPELPNVLHSLTFDINPGEKVGILGRTGSGKSTLALSFFRFVEATEGRILVDGVDISKIGLTDLRSRLTIIPQDPTILSGTLRSTLDVFDEYQDAEIFEALRRVHLIPSMDTAEETIETINMNVFRNLESSVSEGGENFSTGEKQLLCMARAILKRSRVLVMDEATASVDYATDELISKTIQEEFAESTILTIAHRLRTVIQYDRVMLLEEGRIVEFDRPAVLLSDSSSSFYSLCKATGKSEFSMLKKMAGV